MADRLVETVYYKITTAECVDYDKAAPFTEETDDFILSVKDNEAVFQMKMPLPTTAKAKVIIEEYLETWQILIGLQHHPDDLKFTLEKMKYAEESSQDKNILYAETGNYRLKGSDAVLIHEPGKYPDRPKNFKISDDVKNMYNRFKAFKQNREGLTAMAYMCLTILKVSARFEKNKLNLRDQSAKKYRIDKEVLSKLGELSSTKGDELDARKAPKDGDFQPLSSKEKQWIEATIKALIHRAGEYEYDPGAELPQITADDLPPLS